MDKFTLERDDIDALNDETFGCDVGEINDDWEEEHEKFVETTHDKSSVFVDTGSIIHCEPKHSNYSGSALSTIGLLNSSMNKHSNDDLLFPNCEDLIAKNLLDVVSDENDIFCTESASSFSLYHYFDADDNDDEDDVDNNVQMEHKYSDKDNLHFDSTFLERFVLAIQIVLMALISTLQLMLFDLVLDQHMVFVVDKVVVILLLNEYHANVQVLRAA